MALDTEPYPSHCADLIAMKVPAMPVFLALGREWTTLYTNEPMSQSRRAVTGPETSSPRCWADSEAWTYGRTT
ncbi:hypothetical protein EWB00_001696 [Schistosoma japonicum]|uniref:Uncharacterized protein n=1 Tax=Schistosoma japonicum TaxID=6182 RepID=A0A4Z2CJZ4_SCHJA|nr:hypothetical protein EWB00_001696 [Schistosoma japonicum]